MDAAAARALEDACRIVAEKDAQPLRRALFRRKAERTPAIRAALATWDRLDSERARIAFVATYGAKSFAELRVPAGDSPLWAVRQYDNEARQIDALRRLIPDVATSVLTLDARSTRLLRESGVAVRSLHATRAILAPHVAAGDFLVAARVASTIGYFLRMWSVLRESRARAVLVSSDANPCAMALVLAAEALDRRTCFVAHGHVAEGPAPLRFDLSVLDGVVVREVYERAGPIRGRVVLRGVEGRQRPMRSAPLRRGVKTLGVFGSILVDWERAARGIAALRSRFAPERVLLRLHPNREMRDRRWRRSLDLSGVTVSDGDRSLEQDVDECEMVAAGSSSAHLSVAKLGVPTIYVPELDELDDDYYRFVERGVVPRLDSGASRESVAAFFESPDWRARFARFDAAYPDRQQTCERDVALALAALVKDA